MPQLLAELTVIPLHSGLENPVWDGRLGVTPAGSEITRKRSTARTPLLRQANDTISGLDCLPLETQASLDSKEVAISDSENGKS